MPAPYPTPNIASSIQEVSSFCRKEPETMLKKFRIFTPLFIVLQLTLTLPMARAVDRSCFFDVLADLMGGERGYGNTLRPEVYARSENILFLSDGVPGKATHYPLGIQVNRAYPEKRIVSADFGMMGKVQSGNLTQMHLDNTRSFPFPDNSFDTVVLRRGLCVCHSNMCCGGFDPVSPEAQKFFREAVRVMNKNLPKSRIVLHGAYGITPDMVHHWKGLLTQIEQESHVKATMYFTTKGDFLMIGIEPRL
jgi:hypothetical protein